jgi:hypothetical protein
MAIVIRSLHTCDASESFDVSAAVTFDGVERRITFSRFGDDPALRDRTDTFDAFAVAMLLPAMLRGERLVVEGSIDETLLDSLRGPVQDTLRLLDSGWQRVSIEADGRPTRPRPGPSRGAGAGMSGGIDSMHLARHRLLAADVPEPLRLRVFVHHHVGAHGEDGRVFAEQFTHARGVATRLGLPLVGARCTLTAAYRGMPFIHCHTMRHTAASMTLDHLFDAFHYASSEEAGRTPRRGRFSGISTLDPHLLPLFDTPRVRWRSFGGAATRLQKSSEVIEDDRLCSDLLVCIRGFRTDRKAVNCGRCYKCARLLLHAEAVGRLDAVAPTIDMDAWRAGRIHSIGRLLWLTIGPRRNAHEADLLAFLDTRGFRFPWWARPAVAAARFIYGRSDGTQTPKDRHIP